MADTRDLNILLVDDDDLDVQNVKRAFKKNNIQSSLRVASDGQEALDVLRGQGSQAPFPPHRRLVLLDLNMPRMSGIEFLRELRSDADLKTTTVVVLTTSDDNYDRIEAYKLNVAGYLIKPITLTSFIDMMSALNHYWTVNELP